MRRDLLAAVLVCALAALIPPAVAQAGVTRVQAGTRVLQLDGKPWSPVGYSYSPTPVGSAFTPVSYDAASCERDGATMAAAGVNLVRMGLGSTGASPAAPGLKACVAALAGHGVGVAWTLVPPPGTPTAQWLE